MKNYFKNKKILITGGTGSFGSTFLKKLIKTDFSEIRVFSRDEKKQDDLRKSLTNKKIKFYIGDTRDYSSILDACRNIDYIFHAAALKQVPSCEFFPMEAIKTNILGSENLLNAAVNSNVKKVVVLSTDKAVYPINAMGMTKALMEKICLAKSRQSKSKTIICATRYGNVMSSRGSVIPLFIDLIKNGKDITVTDKKMTRFLMSLDDSINLVSHALLNGNSGDIFVQKSPAAYVSDIALGLKKYFNSNSKIRYIGIRHGEKLYESLVSKEEMSRAIESKNYFQIKNDNRDLNYDKYFDLGNSKTSIDYNSNNTKILSIEEIISLFKKNRII